MKIYFILRIFTSLAFCFFFLLSFLVFPSFSQEASTEPEEESMYRHIDLLIKRVAPDIFKAIEKEALSSPVAFVSFSFVGNDAYFENKHRQYLIKSIEGIYKEGNFFRFIKSVRGLNAARLNDNLTEIEYVSQEDKRVLENLTQELGLTHYAIVNLTLTEYKLSLNIQVKSIEKHENLWSGDWSIVWRPSFDYIYLGGEGSFNLIFREYPIFLNFSLGSTLFTLGTKIELGFFLNPGVAFFDLSSSPSSLKVSAKLGGEIRFDILEWANLNYSILEYFFTFRVGSDFAYQLSGTPPAGFGPFVSTPFFSVGNLFILSTNFAFYFDVNLNSIGGLLTGLITPNQAIFLSLGFNYRFSI